LIFSDTLELLKVTRLRPRPGRAGYMCDGTHQFMQKQF
jgi:hypothetical protein